MGFEHAWLLVDCPHPIRKMLHEACASARIDVAARLWPGHLSAGMEHVTLPSGEVEQHRLADYADLVELGEDEELTFGPFSIACHKTLHAVPTTALRIRAGDRCLGFSRR
ncbi:MAG: hypothetical protein ACOC1F_09350 [Myxococcota bacterium]